MGNKLILVVALIVVLLGCGAPDTREPRGALAVASQAVEAGDGRRLFRVIDQRSRFALAAIQQARSAAAALIRADYPADAQAEALGQLGDAAQVADAPDLFVRRCPAACQAAIGALLGAPAHEQVVSGGSGAELEVQTTTGTVVRLYKGNDGHYGIDFHHQALSDERDRAARELDQIRQNAEVYKKRKALDGP